MLSGARNDGVLVISCLVVPFLLVTKRCVVSLSQPIYFNGLPRMSTTSLRNLVLNVMRVCMSKMGKRNHIPHPIPSCHTSTLFIFSPTEAYYSREPNGDNLCILWILSRNQDFAIIYDQKTTSRRQPLRDHQGYS